jgi:phosphoglycerate dehydrogenase-like enzyme
LLNNVLLNLVGNLVANFGTPQRLHDFSPVRLRAIRPIDELLAQTEFVTRHCPSSPQTKKLFNADSLGRMKRGSVVVNLARGDLVDTAAFVAALQSEHVASAAIDVCDPEPIPTESPLHSLPNIVN